MNDWLNEASLKREAPKTEGWGGEHHLPQVGFRGPPLLKFFGIYIKMVHSEYIVMYIYKFLPLKIKKKNSSL